MSSYTTTAAMTVISKQSISVIDENQNSMWVAGVRCELWVVTNSPSKAFAIQSHEVIQFRVHIHNYTS